MKFVFYITVLMSFMAHAQEKTFERVIQVSGSAHATVAPDLGILYIRLSKIDAGMTKAMEGLSKKSDYYTNLLAKLGFKKEDIKTTGYMVSVNRIYRHDQMFDSGYIASQTLKLEFKNNKETINRILNKSTTSEKETDFSFDFRLSDELSNNTKLKLIEQATKNTTTIAEQIASGTKKKLTSLKTVSYGLKSSQMPVFADREFKTMASSAPTDRTFNFTPENIYMEESVSMEWLFE